MSSSFIKLDPRVTGWVTETKYFCFSFLKYQLKQYDVFLVCIQIQNIE